MKQNIYNPEIFILRNGSIDLYRRMALLEEDLQWFRANSYKIYIIELDEINSMKDFYDSMMKTFEFEGYCKNIDSLAASLVDELNLTSDEGGVLVFKHFDLFGEKFFDDAYYLLDQISRISRLYLIDGIKLITLIQMNNINHSFPRFGCYGLHLNLRET